MYVSDDISVGLRTLVWFLNLEPRCVRSNVITVWEMLHLRLLIPHFHSQHQASGFGTALDVAETLHKCRNGVKVGTERIQTGDRHDNNTISH